MATKNKTGYTMQVSPEEQALIFKQRDALQRAIQAQCLETLIMAIVETTEACGFDMREPGKQGITGRVIGRGFDNKDRVPALPATHLDLPVSYNLALELLQGEELALRINLADAIAAIRYLNDERYRHMLQAKRDG